MYSNHDLPVIWYSYVSIHVHVSKQTHSKQRLTHLLSLNAFSVATISRPNLKVSWKSVRTHNLAWNTSIYMQKLSWLLTRLQRHLCTAYLRWLTENRLSLKACPSLWIFFEWKKTVSVKAFDFFSLQNVILWVVVSFTRIAPLPAKDCDWFPLQ